LVLAVLAVLLVLPELMEYKAVAQYLVPLLLLAVVVVVLHLMVARALPELLEVRGVEAVHL
jgi:hypothetical protein